MSKYIGQPCTSCRCVIKEGEDVVVCPVCGSPYHRDCYKTEGKCVNTVLHETGKSWEPEKTVNHHAEHIHFADDVGGEAVGVVCPTCGNTNPSEAVFCSRCGTPVNMEKATQHKDDVFGMPGVSFGDYRKTVDDDAEIDGNSVSDYTRYIGSNFFYYLPKFLRFSKKGSKISFNFSAFLFPNLYFFYRKMPVAGVIFLVLSEILSLPNAVLLMADYGMISSSISENLTFISINNTFVILSYALSIIASLFANWLYYRKAKKDVDKIKRKYSGVADRNAAINRTGGTSIAYLGFAFLLQMLVTIVMMMAILGVAV